MPLPSSRPPPGGHGPRGAAVLRHRKRTRATLAASALPALLILISTVFERAPARGAPAAENGTCTLAREQRHQAVRVLDGETFAIEDGREVRLIGALVPEPPEGVTAEEWIPSREAKAALTSLIEGRNVELALPGRKTDRYGRLLAHVFVPGEGEPIWVQGHMLRHGAARAYAIPGSSACLAALLAAEAAARDSRSGLWSHATYAVRPAADVRALSRQRGRFAVVDGEVMATAERGGRLYINFGADWRRDFTIIVPSRVIRAFPDAALRLREIKGARLRVRGWIDRRNGPSIEVSDAGEIEILEHPPH